MVVPFLPLQSIPRLDLVDLLRAAFWTGSCGVIAANSIECLRDRFVSYGARSLASSCHPQTKHPTQENLKSHNQRVAASDSYAFRFLNYVAALDVPHAYFTQFYVFAVSISFFWGIQLFTRGFMFRAVAENVNIGTRAESMSFNQIVLCWSLFTVQNCRRLYECVTLAKPSKSRMFVGHWLYGFAYYFGMGLAIWIEGTATVLSFDTPLGNTRLSVPSLKTMIFLPVFVVASGIQHDCHCYLASLKKYTLPSHPAFYWIVAPHYTAECIIYLAFSFLAAPAGTMINKTLFSGLVLTVVTLGVSAGITKRWYEEKFGKDQVEHRWKLIPGVW